MDYPIPGVSLVFKDSCQRYLVTKRRNSFDRGMFCFPGGKVEKYESIEEAIIRECLEETGIKILNFRFITYAERISRQDNKHFVILFFHIISWLGEPKNLEPTKHKPWEWLSFEELRNQWVLIPSSMRDYFAGIHV